MQEMELVDPESFRKMLRVEPQMFYELQERLSDRLRSHSARPSISVGLQLAVTLKYLATGVDYQTLMHGFLVAHNSCSKIVKKVCKAIIDEYQEELIRTPQTAPEWQQVADLFGSRWQFHNAIGAIDGKHIRVQKPANSGSEYRNYKGYFSVVLMALVDANYEFLWVEAGAHGVCSDAQIFNGFQLKRRVEADRFNIPDAAPLPGDNQPMPFFFIADDAFALKSWLQKPYSRHHLDYQERILNYRLSRARRVVENAFGILANRFRCLLGALPQVPETCELVVLACVCLHNLMRRRYPAQQVAVLDHYGPNQQHIPGEWRRGVQLDNLDHYGRGNRDTRQAKLQRDTLKAYYNSPLGRVAWQDAILQPFQPPQPPLPPRDASSSDEE
jgi:hypothetical protein